MGKFFSILVPYYNEGEEVIQGMEMETETLEQYLNRMRKLGENQ